MLDHQTAFGFDFGMQRIGVAVGQTITCTALPLAVIKAKDGRPDWTQLDPLIKEWQPQQLVVGLPLDMDGAEQEISHCARKFANRLADRYQCPIALVDERLTTKAARSELKQTNTPVDSYAAKLILESWLRQEEP